MFFFSYCQCLRLLHYTVFYISLIVNMFPLAGVPVGPESYCLQCRYVSLKFSQGQNLFVLGGIKSIGGIKPVNMFINISLFS